MLLERLHLTNFKRFRDQEILFSDGITGIIGNNGAGKSTIVEAILFALYGVRGLGNSAFVVSAAAREGAKAEVVLEFTVRGEHYAVRRAIRRKGSAHEAQLNVKGKKRAEGVSAVETELHRVLGMGYRDFKNTIYAGQKDLLSLLSENPRERRDWFMRILGIDYLRDDTDRELKAQIDAIASRCRELEGALSAIDEPGLVHKETGQQHALVAAEQQLSMLSAARTEEDRRLKEIRTRRDEARTAEKIFIQLQEQEAGRTAEQDRMAREIGTLEEELRARVRLQEEYTVLSKAEERFRALEETLSAMAPVKARFDGMQAEREQRDFRIQQHTIQRERLDREIRSLEHAAERVHALEPEIARFREVQHELERLDVLEKEYRAVREALRAIRERYRGLEQRIQTTGSDKGILRDRSVALMALDEDLMQYDAVVQEQDLLSRAELHARQRDAFRNDAARARVRAQECREEIRLLDAELAGEHAVSLAIRTAGELKEKAAEEQAAQRSKREAYTAELALIDAKIQEILGAGKAGSCPTCHQSLGEHFDTLVQEFRSERARCAEMLAECGRRYERTVQEYREAGIALEESHRRRDALQKVRERREIVLALLATIDAQRDTAQRGEEEEQEMLCSLGIPAFDPDRLRTVTARREALDRTRAQAERLRGECARLPSLEEEYQMLICQAEGCIHEEELAVQRLRDLGFSPEVKEERQKEMQALLPLWQEYLRAQEKGGMVPERRAQIEELHGALEADRRARADLSRELEGLGFDPALYASHLREAEQGRHTHNLFIAVRTRLEEVPALTTQLEGKKAALEKFREESEDLAGRIRVLGHDPRALPLLEESYEATLERLRTTERTLEAQKVAMVHVREEIGRIQQELLRAGQYRTELASCRDARDVLEHTREAMGAFVTYLLNVVKGQVQGEIGDILAEITDGRYDTVTIDDDFNILVHDLGEDYPSQRFSGGEQDDIAIALRIALSRYLAALHQVHDSTFLIFDEIFGSQDEARRGNLLQALRTQEARFPQILIISHIAEVQGEFSHTLSVEMRPDQTSVVQELSA